VTGVRGKVIAYWKANTLPFPEPGVRLIKQTEIEPFHRQMELFRSELDLAVERLDSDYAELRDASRQRLGRLYNANDYPASLQVMFGIDWDFPSIEPPDYLLQLNPAIYEQERARVAARFEEAVQLAEQAFVQEFGRLITHLTERLGTEANGDRKVFRDSAITNLREFFERFRQLNVRSNTDLDALVDRAQDLVHGVGPQDLRDNDGLRQHVTNQLAQVQTSLDQLIVNQPRRRIIRSNPSSNGGAHATLH
jgi:hypothetical protein